MSACTLLQNERKLNGKHHSIIKFDASPSPARLYIHGKAIGSTPLQLDLEVYQRQQYVITALPYDSDHFPQKVTLSEGTLPSNVHFFMDIPTLDKTANEENSTLDQACKIESLLLPVFYYDINLYSLSRQQSDELKDLVCQISNSPTKALKIFGHADETGTQTYNIKLAMLRAAEVKKALVDKGIPEDKITIFGYGEVNIRDKNFNKLSKNNNRKVSFELSLDMQATGAAF